MSFLVFEIEVRERIGVIGGVLKEFFNIFLKSKVYGDVNESWVRIVVGEVIVMFVLESRSNCVYILKFGVLVRFVDVFEVFLVCVNVVRVLRNLCMYLGYECFIDLMFIKVVVFMVSICLKCE